MTDPIATVRESQERMRLIANTLSAADINGLEGICGRAAAALDAVVAEIERLRLHHAAARAECERLAMQLAACGVVALANTTETAYRARAIHQDYRCDAVVAVAAAVDREMAHRAEIAALRAAIERHRHDLWGSSSVDHSDDVRLYAALANGEASNGS